MLGKKSTLQTAQMFVEGVTDENLKNRFGTSVNEYMAHEHSKEIQAKINQLRNGFSQIGKTKNSSITFNELVKFFNERNVNQLYIKLFLYIYSQIIFLLTKIKF